MFFIDVDDSPAFFLTGVFGGYLFPLLLLAFRFLVPSLEEEAREEFERSSTISTSGAMVISLKQYITLESDLNFSQALPYCCGIPDDELVATVFALPGVSLLLASGTYSIAN